ncbi:type 1 glutamine amidotransferase domain-containing protein [Sediminibacillus albus]|uniref:Putative intracellular protease/amidase n=1 Tax=Sediminibacillus albus TaxID=407036 RepID=A0A1G8ZQH8_9BACI|nr:type 1 glutamine amidotransferase domain-containing protein [Sediminibacillus albus]SDK17283.1 Putative intracellular protease/amidase [Sediminibacillus albus]
MGKKVLMVVTSSQTMGDHQTGLWLSEYGEPYSVFEKNGFEITVASPGGGNVPLDPNSYEDEAPDEWEKPVKLLENTENLAAQDPNDFDGVFLPGGHGTMVDFPNNSALQSIISDFAEKDKVIGAVCHGPAGFVNVTLSNGRKFADGRRMTAFTNEEEQKMNIMDKLPFKLESSLRNEGADFSQGEPFADYTVIDGNLVTGQNPQSSIATANQFADLLK